MRLLISCNPTTSGPRRDWTKPEIGWRAVCPGSGNDGGDIGAALCRSRPVRPVVPHGMVRIGTPSAPTIDNVSKTRSSFPGRTASPSSRPGVLSIKGGSIPGGEFGGGEPHSGQGNRPSARRPRAQSHADRCRSPPPPCAPWRGKPPPPRQAPSTRSARPRPKTNSIQRRLAKNKAAIRRFYLAESSAIPLKARKLVRQSSGETPIRSLATEQQCGTAGKAGEVMPNRTRATMVGLTAILMWSTLGVFTGGSGSRAALPAERLLFGSFRLGRHHLAGCQGTHRRSEAAPQGLDRGKRSACSAITPSTSPPCARRRWSRPA